MRYLGFAVLIFIVSCQSEFADSNTQITDIRGNWQLLEVLVDPGDGSGEFEATDLDIMLEIDENLNLEVNGVLCGYSESKNILTGQISLEDSIITANCESGMLRHKFSLHKSNLTLNNLHCREACIAKFIKIE